MLQSNGIEGTEQLTNCKQRPYIMTVDRTPGPLNESCLPFGRSDYLGSEQ